MIITTFKLEKSKRLWLLMLFALLIAVTLIIISFIRIYSKKNSIKDFNIMEIKGYEAEYDLTVISNKTNNTYYMHECYIENEAKNYLKFEFENEMQEKIMYIFKDNSIEIKSDKQINSLNITEYNFMKENLISLSTFLELYKNAEFEYIDNFKIEKSKIDDKTIIIISKTDNNPNDRGFFRNELNFSKLELILDKYDKPIEYYVLSDNNEVKIGIKYTKFNVLEKFDEKIFANFNK